jgi:hypothetical protein
MRTNGVLCEDRLRPAKAHLTLNGWNIHFVSHVKYIRVIFVKRVTWRLHIEMIEAKASNDLCLLHLVNSGSCYEL